MLVGEQPGDQEDLAGEPFVGPAGKLLDRALAAAGLSRGELYVTNAVKHFKWEARGKRRLHKRPDAVEVDALPAGYVITATVHPSSILRAPDPATRETEMAAFIEDLRLVAKQLRARSA